MRLNNFSNEILNEVNLSYSNLQRLSKNITALVGIEYEMYVPHRNFNKEVFDFSKDETVGNFQSIRSFFAHSKRNSNMDLDTMMRQLKDGLREYTIKTWGSYGKDFYYDWIVQNQWDQKLEYDQVRKLHPSMDDQDINYILHEKIQKRVEQDWKSQPETLRAAFAEWLGSEKPTEEDYLDSIDIKMMSDAQKEFNLEWPYVANSFDEGNSAIKYVAEQFQSSTGKLTTYSSEFFDATHDNGAYIVEPDISLSTPRDKKDVGLEFISPPLDLSSTMTDMEIVRVWAKENGCYTNESCGLHINASVPEYSINKLDYVKLILLSEDEHILKTFKRMTSKFAINARAKLAKNIERDIDYSVPFILNKMKHGMDISASTLLYDAESVTTNISIIPKYNRIEFRSVGGDWLNVPSKQIEKIIMQYLVALDAACSTTKLSEEYGKKLYQFIYECCEDSTFSHAFVNHVSGMPQHELKTQIKTHQKLRAIRKNDRPTSQPYSVIDWKNNQKEYVVDASSIGEAIYKISTQLNRRPADFTAELYPRTQI